MSATTTRSTCWACAEELPRGAPKCTSCGEQQPSCWACAEPRPRGAATCPSCGEPPAAPPQGPGGGPDRPSLIYLLGLPILCMVLGHRLGFGAGLGAVLGLGAWVGAAFVASKRSS